MPIECQIADWVTEQMLETPAVARKENSVKPTQLALTLFTFLLGVYLMTSRGFIISADGLTNFITTRQLVEEGQFEISCRVYEPQLVINQETGACYAKYDPGMAVFSVPFYLIGRIFSGPASPASDALSVPRIFVATINQFVTAGTAAVLLLVVYHITKSLTVSLNLALLFGLASIAWPYAVTNFPQPIIGLLLLASFYVILKTKFNTWAGLLWAGVLSWLAIFTRIDATPLVALILLYGVYQSKHRVRALILCAIVGLLGVGFHAIYRFQLLGDVFASGYADEGWTTPFYVGFFGMTLSPNKGILFFSPLVALSIPGFVKLWRRSWQPEVILITALVLTNIAIYMTWHAWEGSFGWGPRFVVTTHVFMFIGIAPWLQQGRNTLLVAVLTGLGFMLSMIGILTSFQNYLPSDPEAYALILYNPLYTQVRFAVADLLQRQYPILLTTQALGVLTPFQTAVWALASGTLIVAGVYGLLRANRKLHSN